jgi:hypothetical protein
MKKRVANESRITFISLILFLSVILTLSFVLASWGSLASSNAGNGTTINTLWFNVSNLGTINSTLNNVTIDLLGTASAGNITNVTLSDGTNIYYNDSFSSAPIIIPVSAAITANTNYTLNFTISSSATDALTVGANVTTISAETNVTYSTLPYPSAIATIDAQNPYVGYGFGTTASSNLSQNYIYVNVSANDTVSYLSAIAIYLYNSTSSLINSSINNSLGSVTSTTHNFNFTNLSDGTYYVNATTNDSFNHINNSLFTRTIILDTTAPLVSFSCDASSISAGSTLTCSCLGSDATSGVQTTSYTVHPSTSSTGTFSTSCTVIDYTGNSASSSISYTVTSSGGGGYPNYRPDEEQMEEGYQKIMRKNWKISFKVNNKSHTFKVEDVTETNAKISISSETQEAILSIGEEKKFELSGDNYYDVLVKLNSVNSDYISSTYFRANFTIQSINEEISSPQQEIETGEEAIQTSPEGEIGEEKTNLTGLWIAIAIIVILILSGIGYKKLKK